MSWAEDMGYDAYDIDDFRSLKELELIFDPQALRLYWTTKAGDKIFIEDMTAKHIENIMRAGLDGRLELNERTEHRFEIELSIRRMRAV